MNVFVVETPLQLLNAKEARAHFGISPRDSLLVLLGGNTRGNRLQLMQLVNSEEWRDVHYLGRTDPLSFAVTELRAHPLLRSIGQAERVMIGEYRSPLMRDFATKLKPRQAVLLDDGVATLGVAQYRQLCAREANPPPYVRKGWKGWVEKNMLRVTGTDLSEITFFTIFSISTSPPDTLIKHDYPQLRNGIPDIKHRNETYFLGSPLVECGYMTEEDYAASLREALEPCDGHTKYIPHRRENDAKVARLASSLDLDVLRLDEPIELVLVGTGILPTRLASFHSTAMATCQALFGNALSMTSCSPDPGLFLNQHGHDAIAIIGNYYSQFCVGPHFTVRSL